MIYRLIFFAIFFATVNCEQKSFTGYKVWNVTAANFEQQKLLHSWKYTSGIDFWEDVSLPTKPIRIMVAPREQMEWMEFLKENQIKNEIIIEDVESVFTVERELLQASKANTFDFNHFWSIDELNDYITHLTSHYGDICSQEIVSTSTEGRLIRAVRVFKNTSNNKSKPAVIIDAGIHAREWIAPMTAIYFMQQLIENSTVYADILDKIDVILIPLMNPDGYEFSHSSNRLWRKNRSRNPSSSCFGVDCNRNYGHMWQGNSFACSDTYAGPSPFSEPESQALRNAVVKYGERVKLYVSLHSYGQYLLYPWGYDYKLIHNWQEHETVGNRFGTSIKSATGTQYTIGNSAYVLYPANGASDDYAASTGISLSYTLELPGGGRYGFDLPPTQINRVTKETWVGVYEMLKYVADKY